MKYTANFFHEISQIGAEVWDTIAVQATPFMQYGYLHALENSGCVHKRTGWQPQHMAVYCEGEPIALLPLYIKFHSMGEFVFDQEWARAYHHHEIHYYPKLVSSVPFTPVSGPRLLTTQTEVFNELLLFALDQIQNLCKTQSYSSWHCLFTPPAQANSWQNTQLIQREGVRFLWFNKHYKTFSDYLSTLNSKKRKMLKRERRKINEQGIRYVWIQAQDMTDTDWFHFYRCYAATYVQRGQTPYLNLQFFELVAKAMPEKLLCLMALKENTPIASSLFFMDETTLYGRYWGSTEDIEFLHFETCYYQGIEYAIQNSLQIFDAGAQGEHKISRGFEPTTTYSWHWIESLTFRDPIAKYVAQESKFIQQYQASCDTLLPFKRKDNDCSNPSPHKM